MINVITYTCAFPAATSQKVDFEKGLLTKTCFIFWTMSSSLITALPFAGHKADKNSVIKLKEQNFWDSD